MKPKLRKKSKEVEMLVISKRLKVEGRWHVLASILSNKKQYTYEETETYARLFMSMADKVPCAYCGYTYDYRRSMAVAYTGKMEEVLFAACSRCEPYVNKVVKETLKQLLGHD